MSELISLVIGGIAIIVVTTVFEFTKALMSTVQGDVIPKNEGKLTLNPIKHFEPIGFLLFLFTGYGWGNPVRTSQLHYKDRKKGVLITYITPIIAAIILGNLVSLIGRMIIVPYVSILLSYISVYFVHIGVFNIIPVYPMCGSRILSCFLEPNTALRYSQNEKLIQMIFMFVWLLGLLSPILAMLSNALLIF